MKTIILKNKKCGAIRVFDDVEEINYIKEIALVKRSMVIMRVNTLEWEIASKMSKKDYLRSVE